MVLEQLDINMKIITLDTDLTTFTKIKSKLITCLHVKHKHVKVLEDNIRKIKGKPTTQWVKYFQIVLCMCVTYLTKHYIF